ncbi:MAG: hypothetical protein WCJ41_21245 [Aestuariivirga sp.]|uniref:hypothetical protein n=1 Tax=Aestuariivirga sp. TaxID=2650926 RepID=UPI00301A9138
MNYAGPFVVVKFRLAPALRFGVSATWNNASLALKMCWPWLVILTGLEIAAGMGPGFPLSLLLQTTPSGYEDRAVLVSLLLAVKLLAVSSLAVNWSRFLLLGEIATGWDRLRIDRPVWRFACNYLLIWFACSGVFLLGSLISFVVLPLLVQLSGYALPEFPRAMPPLSEWLHDTWTLIIAGSLLLGILGGLPIVQRLSIKLVAIAVGREDYGLGDAWRDSGSQSLPLVAYTFAVTGLVTVVWAASFMASLQFGPVGAFALLASAAATLACGLTTILATASVTVLFGLFVERRDI